MWVILGADPLRIVPSNVVRCAKPIERVERIVKTKTIIYINKKIFLPSFLPTFLFLFVTIQINTHDDSERFHFAYRF